MTTGKHTDHFKYTLIAALTAGLFAAAAPAWSADLLEIYRQARQSDAVYAAARATWAASQEKLVQGRAGLLPQASASANTQYNDRDLSFRDPSRNATLTNAGYNSNSMSVTLTQPIFRKQNLVAYEQSKTVVEQADAQLALAGQDLILRVAQAYFDVLLASFNVEVVAAQKAAFAEQLAQAKRNFEVGTATITDANDAQARHDLTVAQEIATQNDLEIKQRQLATIIGRTAPSLAKLSKKFELAPPVPNAIGQWVEQAIRANLQVVVNQTGLEIAQQEVERNKGAHYPTIDAVASYTDSGTGAGLQGGTGLDTKTTTVGLQLAVPIYQGGSVSSRVREALANQDRSRQDLENARRAAELAVRQAFLGVTNGIAQVKALQTAEASSQSSLDSTRLGRDVGVRTQVDVLNAEQQLFSTRRDLGQAVYNYLLSLLRLKAAVGTLAEDDLVRINAWLDR